MIKESEYFSFDGINSKNMGIANVSTDSGLFNETFLSGKQIVEDEIEGRDKRYLKYVKREPLEIPVSFYFEDKWDDRKISQVAQWLSQEEYKPLFFSEDSSKIFYAMVTSPVSLVHNGLKQGYLTLTFRCDTFHAYSSFQQSKVYDLSTNTSGTDIEFDNKGEIELHPKIHIYKVGNGDVTIQNNSNGGKQFKFTGLIDGETVVVDNDYHEIDTDLVNTYRYTNFNMNWFEAVVGLNSLTVYGNCKIVFEYQLKLL